jgi:hypothetical protein
MSGRDAVRPLARSRERVGVRVVAALCVVAALASGCTAITPKPPASARSVELPLVSGWFDGQPVHYVTTDVSDAGMARAMGVNFVPRLADALPPAPARPGQAGAVERIYMITNFEQGNVLPSAPVPTGPDNADRAYSPLWVIVQVTWLPGATPQLLRTEEALLQAADKGWVKIVPTRVVANCPVVMTAQGGALRGARIVER